MAEELMFPNLPEESATLQQLRELRLQMTWLQSRIEQVEHRLQIEAAPIEVPQPLPAPAPQLPPVIQPANALAVEPEPLTPAMEEVMLPVAASEPPVVEAAHPIVFETAAPAQPAPLE